MYDNMVDKDYLLEMCSKEQIVDFLETYYGIEDIRVCPKCGELIRDGYTCAYCGCDPTEEEV